MGARVTVFVVAGVCLVVASLAIGPDPGLAAPRAGTAYRAPGPGPDTFLTTQAAGVPVHVIRINLADRRVRVAPVVAQGFPRTAESFESMVQRTGAVAAVNGAYFSKTTLAPIGDIVIDGRQVHSGLMGTALAIGYDNEAVIRRVQRGHREDWSGFRSVLGCGPALVLDGREDPRPEEEGFRDPHVMGSCPRMGVGLTRDRHLLLVSTLAPVSFRAWARVMRALGCVDAMNLDAGGSTAMYHRGKHVHRSGRLLTNVLAVYVDSTMAGVARRRGDGNPGTSPEKPRVARERPREARKKPQASRERSQATRKRPPVAHERPQAARKRPSVAGLPRMPALPPDLVHRVQRRVLMLEERLRRPWQLPTPPPTWQRKPPDAE